MTDFDTCFRIIGKCGGERRIVRCAAAAFAAYCECDSRASIDREAYLSAFVYPDAFADHVTRMGTPKGYAGECWATWLWWDIDRPDDSERARIDAIALAGHLCGRYAIDDELLLIFFSGGKGYHVGLPSALILHALPSVTFHLIARRFCENVAAGCGVTIDPAVYVKVQPFRAPNSKHGRTGLHKRRFTRDELIHCNAEAIARLAADPLPFDVPTIDPTAGNGQVVTDWTRAAAEIEAEQSAKPTPAAVGADRVNRATLDFIRDGAAVGDRHRSTYLAARNLTGAGCSPNAVHGLLTDAALDTGLSPSDVRRQIECGIADGMKGGAAA